MFNIRNKRTNSARKETRSPTDVVLTLSASAHEKMDRAQLSSDCSPNAGADAIQLENLMESVTQQAVEINCEMSRFSDLARRSDLLSSRFSTLQPLVGRLIASKEALEASLESCASERDVIKRMSGELDAELSHLRPMTLRLQEELHSVTSRHQRALATNDTLEAKIKQVQHECNDLIQKLGTAETQTSRLKEENLSLKKSALENASHLQGILREMAGLRSTTVGAGADLERQTKQFAQLSDQLLSEKELSAKAAAQVTSLELRHAQIAHELQMRVAAAEEREQELINKLAISEKRIYEFEFRNSAIESKADFLMRGNERLRDEMRARIDHTSMLEASNRQLLEAVTVKSVTDSDESGPKRDPVQVGPILRAVNGEV